MRSPDEGFDLEGPPKPKILRDPSPKKRNLVYVDFRDRWGAQKPFFSYGTGRTPGAVPHPRRWLQSRSPKATTLDFCRKFRAQPVQRGPGADLGHKTAQNSEKLRSARTGPREHKNTQLKSTQLYAPMQSHGVRKAARNSLRIGLPG